MEETKLVMDIGKLLRIVRLFEGTTKEIRVTECSEDDKITSIVFYNEDDEAIATDHTRHQIELSIEVPIDEFKHGTVYNGGGVIPYSNAVIKLLKYVLEDGYVTVMVVMSWVSTEYYSQYTTRFEIDGVTLETVIFEE